MIGFDCEVYPTDPCVRALGPQLVAPLCVWGGGASVEVLGGGAQLEEETGLLEGGS